MVKKWSEVAGSPDFAALADEDKDTVRESYFERVVAPEVAPDQLEQTRERFERASGYRRRALPTDVKPSTAGPGRSTIAGPTARDMGAAPPIVAPPPLVPVSEPESTPNPEFDTGTPAPFDPAKLPGGSVLDRPAPGYSDPRVGDEEYAQNFALSRAPQPKIPVPRGNIKNSPLEVAIGSTIRKSVGGGAGGAVASGVVGGLSQLGGVVPGLTAMIADFAGAEEASNFARGAAQRAEGLSESVMPQGEGINKTVANIFASTVQSLPTMAFGGTAAAGELVAGKVVAGAAAQRATQAAMLELGVQTLGQEYGSARNKIDPNTGKVFEPGESMARASVFAAAEVLGERFGFREQMTAIKALVGRKPIPAEQLAEVLATQVMKEIPGEQLTTAIQFLADKYGPAAQDPKATLQDYFKQALDTAVQTVGQAGLMGAPGAVRSTFAKVDARGRYDAAMAAGLQLDPPLVTDRPATIKSKTFGMFVDAAAHYGIPRDVVKRAKEATADMPAAQVGPFLSRLLTAVNKRGLVPSLVDQPAVDALAAGPALPPPETKPAEPETPVPQTEKEAAVDEISKILGVEPAVEGLTTADGMPYGTKASAQARATREGGGEVVEVPGGWVVRPESASAKDAADRIPADSEDSRNRIKAVAEQTQSFDSLGIEDKRVVQGNVLAALQDDKVRRSVVERVPIQVVNILIGKNGPASGFLNDPAVLFDRLSTSLDDPVVAARVGVFVDAVAASHPGALTGLAAEKQPALASRETPSVDAENDRAHGAGDGGSHSGIVDRSDTTRPFAQEPPNAQPSPSNAPVDGEADAGRRAEPAGSGRDLAELPADRAGQVSPPAAAPAPGRPAPAPVGSAADVTDAVATWTGAAQSDRERFLIGAGWHKGSKGMQDMLEKPWDKMTVGQQARLTGAIGVSAKAAPPAAAPPPMGVRAMLERQQQAGNRFVESVVEQFGLTKKEAERALKKFQDTKLVKLDPLSGQFQLKTGQAWDRDVMRRAAGIEEAPPAAAPPAGAPHVVARAGVTPAAADPIELRPNAKGTLTIFHGKHELLGFESGEPLEVPTGTSDDDVLALLKTEKAFGRSTKIFRDKAAPAEAAPALADASIPEAAVAEPAAPPPPDLTTLLGARNALMDVRTQIEQQGTAVDDRLLERERKFKKLVADFEREETEPPAASQTSSVAVEKPEVAPPSEPAALNAETATRQEVMTALMDEGKVHRFGTTTWLEKKADNWVVREREDGSSTTFTIGPVGEAKRWGWAKIDAAQRAVQAWAFKEDQKPAAATAAPTGEKDATQERPQQGIVQAEREDGDRPRQAAEAGRGDRVQRTAAGEGIAPTTETLTDEQAFAQDYKAFEGATLEQTVQVSDTGQTAVLKMDAAKAMRDIDARLKAMKDLRLCIGAAA